MVPISRLRPDITFFTSSMGSGGAQRTISNLARGFAKNGYDVELLLLRKEGPYLEDIPNSITVTELRAERAMKSLPELVRYFHQSAPEVFFSTMEYLNVVSLMSAKFARTSSRIAIRAANIRTERDRHGLKHLVEYRLARLLYPTADHIFALSNGVKREMVERYALSAEAISVVYNPVRVSEIQEQSRQPVNLPTKIGSEIVLAVGRLSPQKDYPTLIQAFKQLTEKRNVELIILGEGDQLEMLTNLAQNLDVSDQVHFLGFVDNPFPYMKKADVFVLSSKWEGFGNVIVEAMACGSPIVATDCPGGPSEILEDGRYGRLVPVGDIESLTQAISSTIEDPPTRSTLLNRAKSFQYDRIVDKYEKILFREDIY